MTTSPQNSMDLTFWFIVITFLVAIVWGLSAVKGSRSRY
jgi:Na+-transporting methylmalonyl-CoA/oxaloacetate decarboxylase gamma subunit